MHTPSPGETPCVEMKWRRKNTTHLRCLTSSPRPKPPTNQHRVLICKLTSTAKLTLTLVQHTYPFKEAPPGTDPLRCACRTAVPCHSHYTSWLVDEHHPLRLYSTLFTPLSPHHTDEPLQHTKPWTAVSLFLWRGEQSKRDSREDLSAV